MGALRPPVTEERLRAEIERYDPAEAGRVRDRVRREAGRTEAVERLVGVYEELAALAPSLAGEGYERECLRAASDYIAWLGPYGAEAAVRIAVAEGRVAVAEGRTLAAEGRVAKVESLERELATARETLDWMERSPLFRLRSRLIRLRPLVSLYRRFRRPAE
jgi:hypothetical protein